MKIDPNNPLLKELISGTARGAKGPPGVRFGDLLGKALATPDPKKTASADLRLMQSISGIQLKADLTAEPSSVTSQVEDLLDLLDTYREMLADPGSTLREIAPLVERIAAQRDKLADALDAMEADGGLHDLVNQTLITASTEVVKFNKGDYIDA